jgi:hypothetical protein
MTLLLAACAGAFFGAAVGASLVTWSVVRALRRVR